MSEICETQDTGRLRTPQTVLMRRNVVAESPLEIKQVYKLLQLVNHKKKEQIEKLVRLGVSGLINLTEPEDGVSALHLASRNNDVEMAHFLLSLNAHPDIQDKKGRTPIMYAAKHGHVDMVKFLIHHQADLTVVDKKGKGLLFYCIGPTGRHKQIMEMALDMKLDVNSTSYTGKSVFMAACEQAKECENLCMLLLERGADVDVADPKTGCTALMAAVTAGSVVLVRAILQKGVNPDTGDKTGVSAVHIAASKGFFEVLRLLSAYSADLNVTDKHGNTALHLAASEDHAECCRFLFQRGCNMKSNMMDLLPSQVAMKNSHKAALKELQEAEKILKTGKMTFFSEARLHDWSFEHEAVLRQAFQSAEAAEFPVETVSNETFMSVLQAHYAPIDEEDLEVIVRVLDKNRQDRISISEFFAGHFLPKNFQLSSYKSAILETSKSEKSEPSIPETCHGRSEPFQTSIAREQPQVDVSSSAWMYKTPLMTACIMGKYQMAQFLISRGAEVNAYDQFKWTSLHHACKEGHADIVKLLLTHGAIIDAATTNGVTPLMRAIQSCNLTCVELLLKAGANVEATNNRGQDCMTIAQLYGTVKIQEMVKIFFDKAMKKKAGKKLPPRTKKPASKTQTPKTNPVKQPVRKTTAKK
ncbi:ankyrin repeat and EF-hand domain-containing protein 1-like [Hemibagrus wyckioides]|nr:ankyrin repeat and EF-hand domain-containing protein 1-like [Hemibagrus wyckioides]